MSRFEPSISTYQGVDASTASAATPGAANGHPVFEEDVGEPEVPVADDRELVGRPHHLHLDGVEVSGNIKWKVSECCHSTQVAFMLLTLPARVRYSASKDFLRKIVGKTFAEIL